MFGGDILRHRHADLGNADREKPALERQGFRRFDRVAQIERVPAEFPRRVALADIKPRKFIVIDREEIKRILDDASVDQNVGDFSAQRLEIERIASGKMLKPAAQLLPQQPLPIPVLIPTAGSPACFLLSNVFLAPEST